MKKRILSTILLVTLALAPLAAEDMASFTLPSTASAGRGGHHVAWTDDIYALFVNPAALMTAREWSILQFSPALIGDTFKILDIVSGGGDVTGKLGDFSKESGGKIPFGLDLRFPIAFGYAGNGLGYGLFNRVSFDAKLADTDVEARLNVDVVAKYGMAFKILDTRFHRVNAGFGVKGFGRSMTSIDANALDAMSDFMKVADDSTIPMIMGGGLDLGFMYIWREDLSAALVFDDVFTRGVTVADMADKKAPSNWTVPFSANIGTAYHLPWVRHIADVHVMMDYHDIGLLFTSDDYTKRNPALGLSLGAEAQFLKRIALRVGMNEMLPAVGLGLRLGSWNFDFAMYGKELGLEPGSMSTYVLDLGLSWRPKAKTKQFAWTKNSLVGVIANKRGGSSASGPAPSALESAESAAEEAQAGMDAAFDQQAAQ
ncbi:MAG: hypothetical protein LBS64_00755 [Spirochaetaceae bacterium]|jgi:hypothetical protein|nr:hypothetical protein [Spirochaetaceae bacterium]